MHCVPESVAALRGSYCKTPFDPRVKQLAEQPIGAPWCGTPRSAAQHAACGVHLDALCPRSLTCPHANRYRDRNRPAAQLEQYLIGLPASDSQLQVAVRTLSC